MLLLNISIALVIAAVLSLVIYIFSASKRRKKEKKKTRRFFGAIAVLCTLAAAVLFIIYCRSNNIKIFNRLKEYDPVLKYSQVLIQSDAQGALPYLPDAVFAQGESVYFKNGKGDLFKIQALMEMAATGDREPVPTGVVYKTETVSNGAQFVGGGKTLRALITDKNELILDGYLQYSEYDGGKIEFKNKVIAKDVVYCDLTSNSVLYITKDGSLYGLGFNEYGQLGDTTTKNKSTPTFVTDNISRCAISETHSMTVDSYGIFKAVGDNSYSQLGNKTAISSTEPIKIMQGIKDVKAGNYLSLVLAVNGQLFTAGNNDKGQLGNGGQAFKAELISIMNGVKKIDVNGSTVAALTFEGDLFVWGDNEGFKAGFEKEGNIPSPVKIKSDVYDFALSDTGVAVITNNRDIELSDSFAINALESHTADSEFEKALQFNATLPEEKVEGDTINDQNQADAV